MSNGQYQQQNTQEQLRIIKSAFFDLLYHGGLYKTLSKFIQVCLVCSLTKGPDAVSPDTGKSGSVTGSLPLP